MAGSLTVQRIHLTGTAPAQPELAGRCRAVLDRLDERRLGAALARAFDVFGDDDPRQIVLRRVDLSLEGVESDDPDRIAAQLAQGIAALVGRIGSAPAGEGVVVFENAAERLALYVKARALGQAADAWWFSDFAALGVLPRSSAIRTALARDIGTGLTALARLDDRDRARVLAALSRTDAIVLLEDLGTLPRQTDREAAWNMLARRPRVPPSLGGAAGAIHLFAALAALSAPDLPDANLIPMLELLALADRTGDEVAPAIAAGDVRHITALLPQAPPQALHDILHLPPRAREAMVAATSRAADPRVEAQEGHTPFGGLLMLYPHLPAFAEAQLADTAGEPAGVAALLALASLRGKSEAEYAMGDPILHGVFGIARHPDFAQWLARSRLGRAAKASPVAGAGLPASLAGLRGAKALEAAGRMALAQFARKLPGLGGSGLAHLRANLLDVGARVTLGEDTVHAVIERPPLDVLLSISGLADTSAMLPDGRRLILERAP